MNSIALSRFRNFDELEVLGGGFYEPGLISDPLEDILLAS